MMLLLISVGLALIPLLGVAAIAAFGSPLTVDGLFMSLILLAISALFWSRTFLEYRVWKSGFYDRIVPANQAAGLPDGGLMQRGRVESVEFFESHVGQPNKSIVTLSEGFAPARMLVFEGDMRNALPTGQKVQIVLRKMTGYNVLVDVSYS
jgi:hypothetical protein